MNIRNKTIVLTGASGGIGRAIAEKLNAEGARLILVGRNEQKLTQLVADLGDHPHVMVLADLGDDEGRQQLLDVCRNIGPEALAS